MPSSHRSLGGAHRSLAIGADAVSRRMLAIALGGLMGAFSLSGVATAQATAPSLGENLFKSRCAACHDPASDRAPGLSTLNQMSQDQIFSVLHGKMAPMASGLSEAQKREIAVYLGKKPIARPTASPPASAKAAAQKSPAAPGAGSKPASSAVAKKAGPVAAAPSLEAVPTLSANAPTITNLPAAPTLEWRAYKGNYASQNYAALDQINKDTVKGLHIAWRQSLTPDAVRKANPAATDPTGNNQMTPLMVGGVVYFSSGVGGVVALDAETGKLIWHTDAPVAAKAKASAGGVDKAETAVPVGGATRALSYWTDGKGDERIIALIGNQYLTALNAKTGARYPDFGDNGEVDLIKNQDKGGDYFAWLTGPNVIVNGVVIIGSAVDDINDNRRVSKIDNQRGDVRGIDVRTGKQLWTFHSIPQAGEFGNDTWLDKAWVYTGNANAWAPMSGDEELGLVYVPLSTPSNDWYGGKRQGAGLFADGLVALDARTGERKWHFQAVHHGLWDYDLPCAPVLADITVDGRKIKVLAQPSKQAYLYVLDRATGEPVWPIIEQAVPQGDAPGEWYSPTQPMPLDSHGRPFAYDQQGVSTDNLIDFTPELKAEAVKILDQYAYGPLYYPIVVGGQGRGAGKLGSLHMPSSSGGTNWPGAGLDPETNILYVPSVTATRAGKLSPPPAGSDTVLVRGEASRPNGPEGLPLFKGPYGRLVAIDLNKGELKWTAANGDGPRDHPALKDLNLPQLGQPGRVGPLVTKSLVFMGDGMSQTAPGSGGKMFRAFDKATGRVVWQANLPGETTGVPMTYAWKGKQYIIVPIGGPGHPGEFVALTIN